MRSDASRLSVETPYFNFALSALGRRADFEPGALRQAITYRAFSALLDHQSHFTQFSLDDKVCRRQQSS